MQCVINTGVPPLVRGEGLAELVGQATLNCSGGTPTAAGVAVPTATIRIFLNTNITSRIVSSSGSTNWSEALLTVDEPHTPSSPNTPLRLCGDALTNEVANSPGTCQIFGTGTGRNVYSGANGFTAEAGAPDPRNRPNVFQAIQTSANSLEWRNVPIDPPGSASARILRFMNIRANANQLGVSNTLVPTRIDISFTSTGTGAFRIAETSTQTVAFALAGLSPASVRGAGSFLQSASQNEALATGNSSAPIPEAYTGGSSTLGNQGFQFQIRVQEGFASAFKPLNIAQADPLAIGYPLAFFNQNVPGLEYRTEDGFVNSVTALGRTYVEPNPNPPVITGGAAVGSTPPFPDVRGMRTAGAANHGTRVIYQFNRVPNGLQLWVPGVIRVDSTLTGARTGTARLTTTDSNGATGFFPTAVNAAGYTQVPIFNGMGYVVYEILASNAFTEERIDLPVAVSYLANSGNNLPTPDLQSNVTVSLAPLSIVGSASDANPLPRFASTQVPVDTFRVIRSTTGGQLTVMPTSLTAAPTTGQLSVTVGSSTPPLSWAAVSNTQWITVDEGASGTGNGVVRFTAAANPLSVERVGTLTIAGQTVTVTQAATTGLQFVAVAPCRVADTRNPAGPLGGPGIGMGATRDFAVPQSPCGIPVNAVAYALNVTVVPTGPLGFITTWPTGQPRPLASTLNSLDGRIKANAAVVPAGTNGSVSVYATEGTQVILDISGYYAPRPIGGLVFYPLTPCRTVDTRPSSTMAASETRALTLRGTCGIPANAAVVSLNATVVPKGPLGFLTLWPQGTDRPTVSTLNALTGTVTANAATVPLSGSGQINAYVTDATDLVLDVNGYYASPGVSAGGLQYYTATSCRLADTRNATGPLGGPQLAANVERTLPVLSSGCFVPSVAQAYVLNATVVPSGPFGFLSLWAAGAAQPVVSTLNAVDGFVTSNLAIVPAGANGAISMLGNSAGHVVFDVMGYFAP
jgi:hypothetical protein